MKTRKPQNFNNKKKHFIYKNFDENFELEIFFSNKNCFSLSKYISKPVPE